MRWFVPLSVLFLTVESAKLRQKRQYVCNGGPCEINGSKCRTSAYKCLRNTCCTFTPPVPNTIPLVMGGGYPAGLYGGALGAGPYGGSLTGAAGFGALGALGRLGGALGGALAPGGGGLGGLSSSNALGAGNPLSNVVGALPSSSGSCPGGTPPMGPCIGGECPKTNVPLECRLNKCCLVITTNPLEGDVGPKPKKEYIIQELNGTTSAEVEMKGKMNYLENGQINLDLSGVLKSDNSTE